jgi:serine/threonine protein kinase
MAADYRNGVALVIGVGDYLHPGIQRLEFAADDASAVAELLADPRVCGFPRERVQLLIDADAGRDAIVGRLSRWLPENGRGADLAVVYFAGHGMVQTVGKQEEGFLLPADADPDNPAGRGVPMADLARWIEGIEASAVVVCLDCCHAGKILHRGDTGHINSRNFAIRPDVLQGIAGKGRYLLASCDEGEVSVELSQHGHGLFTYHLLRGIEGEGDRDGDGRVGVAELFEYVSDAVARDAEKQGMRQHPWNLSVAAGGVYISAPRGRPEASSLVSFERRLREEGSGAVLREIERRMAGADDALRVRLLRRLAQLADPASIPLVFGCLTHSCEEVRGTARRAVQAIGWTKAMAVILDLARADAATAETLLAGLAVFEAHPDLVRLLDHLGDALTGDLRVRANQLLERKQLGLGLEQMAEKFRESHSPYRLERVLGQGLFTAAYLARHTIADFEAVVRVLRPEFAGKSAERQQFLDLCRKAIRFHHPNLAHTLEVQAFPHDNLFYTVREFLPEVTLQQVLDGGRTLEPAQVVEVLRQAVEAMTALHPNGICHGGIKPSNLFLRTGDRVVLGDLSLPPQGMGEALKKRLAYDYRYAAPETFMSQQAPGPAADFYSLGCVAYELFCGSPPFVSDHYNDLLVQHVTRPVPPPAERRPGLAAAVAALLLRLLDKDPARRPASPPEMLRALDEVAAALRRPPESGGEGPKPPARPDGPRPQDTVHGGVLPKAAEEGPPPGAEDSMAPAGATLPPSVHLLPEASLARYRPAQSLFSMGESRPLTMRPPEESLAAAGDSLAPPVQPLPFVVPGYEILSELGKGGMGVVYQARQTRLNRLVALKMILHAEHASKDERRRFAAEAEAVARLQHPNIVQIFEIGEHRGLPYFSLEYCGGRSLEPRLNGTPWEAKEAARLVETLARAMAYAHQRGIVHRDLKPANVLLGGDGAPKITDFGLAKRLDVSMHTQSGAVMGTPSYMAPEQAQGRVRDIGPGTDIWALGAILYELLTGRPPFKAQTALDTVLRVISDEPVSVRRLQPRTPPDLETICLKCLQKEPAKRYASAQYLAEDLQRFLGGEPIKARRVSLPERAAKWVRRRPTVKAFLWMAGLAALLAALVWALR